MLAVVAIIVVGKSLAAFALVLAFRYPLNTALTVVGQPGADRRVLLHPGRRSACRSGCCRREGQSLILAGALISIALNPLLFAAIEPLQRWLRARSALARELERATIRWPSCR